MNRVSTRFGFPARRAVARPRRAGEADEGQNALIQIAPERWPKSCGKPTRDGFCPVALPAVIRPGADALGLEELFSSPEGRSPPKGRAKQAEA